jgi:hypothetical protein
MISTLTYARNDIIAPLRSGQPQSNTNTGFATRRSVANPAFFGCLSRATARHSAGKDGKLQLGTLPLPEMLDTFTSVPEAVMFEL